MLVKRSIVLNSVLKGSLALHSDAPALRREDDGPHHSEQRPQNILTEMHSEVVVP